MSAKKIINNARQRREAKAGVRALKRAARLQKARAEVADIGLLKIVRWPELEVMTNRGRTAIQNDINAGRFPKPIPLGGRAVGFLIEEVEAWIAARAAERHQHHEAAE